MTTSWSADDLRSASRLYDACGDGIAAVSGTVTAMDPASYGSFVAHAAAGAEPATSEASRECIRAIAAATGAQAGCVTACSAAGITLAIAACLSGSDPAAVRRLPQVAHGRNRVVMLKGHVVDFGADVRQMVRLAGAQVVEAGSASFCHGFELEDALDANTAAILFVVSHLTAQRGMPALREVAALAQARGLPLIVDAAAETDLRRFHEEGADLVIQSVHKFLRGPTAGIVSGRADLVAAVNAQSEGIGRTMKVGKEAVAGALAALGRTQRHDHAADRARWRPRLDTSAENLANLPGLRTEAEHDPTGNPLVRLRIDVDGAHAGIDAVELARRLREDHRVFTRDHLAGLGYILVDPRSLEEGDDQAIAQAIRAVVMAAR